MRNHALSILLFAVFCMAQAHAAGDAETGKMQAYTCTGCHGISGYNNVYPTYKVPKLGAQNADYIVSALKAYQSGDRQHPTMQLHAQSLSVEEMENIAAWATEFTPAAVVETSPPEQAAICQSCHGQDGRGADPGYPALGGQHKNYLTKALQDYRSGARRNAIMGGFASALSDEDIEILSSYYADMGGLQTSTGQ